MSTALSPAPKNLIYPSESDHSRTNVPGPLRTPSIIDRQGSAEISAALNGLVADAFALYIKTKNYHWHLATRHFRDYHLLFDEQADQIFASIDVLAERVRKVGGTTIRSVGHVAELQSIKDCNEEFVNARDMLTRLCEDNKLVAGNMLRAHEVCEENNDVASASILEVLIDETERRVWFLNQASEAD